MTSEILHRLSKQMKIFPIYSNSIQHAILFTHFEAFCISDTPRSVLVIIPTLQDVLVVLWTCHVISARALTRSHSCFLSKSNLFLVCSQRTKTRVISRVRKQKVRCLAHLSPGPLISKEDHRLKDMWGETLVGSREQSYQWEFCWWWLRKKFRGKKQVINAFELCARSNGHKDLAGYWKSVLTSYLSLGCHYKIAGTGRLK